MSLEVLHCLSDIIFIDEVSADNHGKVVVLFIIFPVTVVQQWNHSVVSAEWHQLKLTNKAFPRECKDRSWQQRNCRRKTKTVKPVSYLNSEIQENKQQNSPCHKNLLVIDPQFSRKWILHQVINCWFQSCTQTTGT